MKTATHISETYVVVHHLRPQQEVEAILFDLTPLHIDLKGISIRVLDSVLYLDGGISSQLPADIAEDQVMDVPGLLKINNKINA